MKFQVFLMFSSSILLCTESCQECPRNVEKLSFDYCDRFNPCRRRQCPISGAYCWINRCGGCTRLWYAPALPLSAGPPIEDVTRECERALDFRCPSSTDCHPGHEVACPDNCRNATCPGFPMAKCCNNHCGTCTIIWYDATNGGERRCDV